jgi:hypothetical protein
MNAALREWLKIHSQACGAHFILFAAMANGADRQSKTMSDAE